MPRRFHHHAVASLGTLTALLSGCADRSALAPATPPPNVRAETIVPRSLTIEAEFPGRARGQRDIEVRARVEGILETRAYVEGESVATDALLFRIDPKPFEVALREAQAQLAQARADARQAAREWARVRGLFAEDAVSAQERDRAIAADELAQAAVQLAEARVETARINLGYTQVRAPAAGATSLEVLPEGSLVRPGDLLTRITVLDPVQVVFALPEGDPLALRTAGQTITRSGPRPLPARARLPDGSDYDAPGVVNFRAASVDPQTGTVQARAVFPNPDGVLLPGQFLRVRVQVEQLEGALVVPPKSLVRGVDGSHLWVVDAQNQARQRTVRLGSVVPEGQVISEGLEPHARVIVEGFAKVSDGQPVAILAPESGTQPQAP